jgi:general stress protein CsbA
MFRLFIVAILAGFLYLGYQGLEVYKQSNMTEAELAQQEQAEQREAAATKKKAKRYWNILSTPVWKLESDIDRAVWWLIFPTVLAILLAPVFVYWGRYKRTISGH